MWVSRNTLSPQCSWSSAASGSRPASMSTTAGSSSNSTKVSPARSSASARVSAMHMAIISPT